MIVAKFAGLFGIVGLVAAATTNDVIIAIATLLNSGLLLLMTYMAQHTRKAVKEVQATSEKTFQSTTHAAKAADGAARAAAISTIVATRHLGVDMRDEDIELLTDGLKLKPDLKDEGSK